MNARKVEYNLWDGAKPKVRFEIGFFQSYEFDGNIHNAYLFDFHGRLNVIFGTGEKGRRADG